MKKKFESIKDKQAKTFETLKGQLGYKNVMQAPKLLKIVINTGIGRAATSGDKRRLEIVPDRLAKITGQKASPRQAKQSIASFKLREGEVIGYQVTLRGKKMNDFLDKLLNVALPRTKDFRGLPATSIDAMGNYSLGIKEHTIFPETADEELRDVFGMTVTVVTSSKDKKQTEAFLKHLGFPFKKN